MGMPGGSQIEIQDEQRLAARTQALFRQVNERIEGLNEDFSAITPDAGDWVCECADESCVGLVRMSVAEYAAVRSTPNWFLVIPDDKHVVPRVERVVLRTERYWIVETFGAGELVAKEADPRSRG